MRLAARLDGVAFEGLQLKIEIGERLILDVARGGAQRFEFRETRYGCGALGNQPMRAARTLSGRMSDPTWSARNGGLALAGIKSFLRA